RRLRERELREHGIRPELKAAPPFANRVDGGGKPSGNGYNGQREAFLPEQEEKRGHVATHGTSKYTGGPGCPTALCAAAAVQRGGVPPDDPGRYPDGRRSR